MQIYKLPFSAVPQLSHRDKAYVEGNGNLAAFYKYKVHLDSFAQVIEDKAKDPINRPLLVETLKEQYANLPKSDKLEANIESLLDSKTFTVTTAHQPSLFTGPLYYIYKIISTINLAKNLKEKYPHNHFVPVFITGGEDHDFEEVQNVHIFHDTLTWESGETGSVGAMKTKGLKPVLAQLKEILSDRENDQKIYDLLHRAYTENEIYSDGTIQMVNELFMEDGLVVLNMNHPKLKAAFAHIIKEEIIEQPSIALVEATSEALDNLGFKQQATPREINFFYLRDQIRERIVFEEGKYQVLNTDFSFTETEMIAEIENHPEYFSPNVVMRPLYQECILPNLAYIGGGGELAYWLERKTQFNHFKINYPMLIRRNSVMWLDKGNTKKLAKLNLSVEEIFTETEDLIKIFIQKVATDTLSLEKEKKQLSDLFDAVAEKAGKIDPTLSRTVLAEGAKQAKSLDQLEGKIVRTEKQKHETALQQIRGLKEKLFPNHGLQERKENFISYYVKYGDKFIDTLKANLDPLEKGFVVVVDE